VEAKRKLKEGRSDEGLEGVKSGEIVRSDSAANDSNRMAEKKYGKASAGVGGGGIG